MSKTAAFFIAVNAIHQTIDGKNVVIEPGYPIFNLEEEDVIKLKKLRAIREPSKLEIDAEELKQRKAAEASENKASQSSGRRRGKKADGEGDGEGEGSGEGDI